MHEFGSAIALLGFDNVEKEEVAELFKLFSFVVVFFFFRLPPGRCRRRPATLL